MRPRSEPAQISFWAAIRVPQSKNFLAPDCLPIQTTPLRWRRFIDRRQAPRRVQLITGGNVDAIFANFVHKTTRGKNERHAPAAGGDRLPGFCVGRRGGAGGRQGAQAEDGHRPAGVRRQLRRAQGQDHQDAGFQGHGGEVPERNRPRHQGGVPQALLRDGEL